MEITAQLKNLRIAPRKVRLASRVLKGLDAPRAKIQLEHMTKRSARPLIKLLDSAVANAHHNFGLVRENLFVKDMVVNEGPKLKRFRPKGFGTVSPIEKKTSHVRIILDERVPGLKAKPGEKHREEEIKTETENKTEKIAKAEKMSPAKPVFNRTEAREKSRKGMFGRIGNLSKRFFRRKAI